MFVTNWISTTKIQKISEITNFFRHYFLSRTEVKNRCFISFDFFILSLFFFFAKVGKKANVCWFILVQFSLYYLYLIDFCYKYTKK